MRDRLKGCKDAGIILGQKGGEGLQGKIKKLIRERGFGFITAEDGKDVFFHRFRLWGISFANLKEGDRVKFDLERGDRGLRAVNVSLIRG